MKDIQYYYARKNVFDKASTEVGNSTILELINKYPQAFNKDFDNNKEMVATLTDVQTVPMRNKIAGYITRYLSHPEA